MALFTSVEYVEVSITASSEPVTVNLTKGQDETQCTPFFSVRTTGAITDRHVDRCGEVEFVDNAGTAAVRVSAAERVDNQVTLFAIFVIEWDPSITVQQVAVTGFTGTSINQAIDDVTAQANAFFLYSYQFTDNPGGGNADNWDDAAVQTRFNGASTTSVTLSRRASGGTCDGTLYVIEAGAGEFVVDHREIDVTSASAASGTDTIGSTVEADTFLVHSYETSENSDDMRDGAWVADLQDSTTVRIRRTVGATPSATSTHSIAVVEAQNSEWDVQRNDALTLATATVTDSITAIDEERTFINVLTLAGQPFSVGRNDSTTGGEIDSIQCAADFSAADTVRFQKRVADLTDDIISYEVVQFAEAAPDVLQSQVWM